MSHPPICFLAHNRPDHTRSALKALSIAQRTSPREVFVFIDPVVDGGNSDLVDQVINICKEDWGFKKMHLHVFPTNLGLGTSMLAAVDYAISKHEKLIVVEDDIVIAPHALDFFATALARYKENEKVMAACAYIHDDVREIFGGNAFFSRRGGCWGWATWRDRWDLMNRDSKKVHQQILSSPDLVNFFKVKNSNSMIEKLINGDTSWSPLWYATAAIEKRLFLYPPVPLAKNIGFDGSGAHKVTTEAYDVDIVEDFKVLLPTCVGEHPQSEAVFQAFFQRSWGKRITKD